jgi:hypothetical protein
MQALEIADQAASVTWERAGDKTPIARLRLAIQAAMEQLEGIRTALSQRSRNVLTLDAIEMSAMGDCRLDALAPVV